MNSIFSALGLPGLQSGLVPYYSASAWAQYTPEVRKPIMEQLTDKKKTLAQGISELMKAESETDAAITQAEEHPHVIALLDALAKVGVRP